MVVPTSVDAQFRRLDKHLRELEHVGGAPDSDDASIIVADICNSSILVLDKAMNAVWEAIGRPKEGKSKPHIYFPTTIESREKLIEKFGKYQMPNIVTDSPKVFDLVDSVQVYSGVTWLAALYKIAAIRHEKYPAIHRSNEERLSLGNGQDLHIDSITMVGNWIVNFEGYGINQKSGRIEPVRVELTNEVRSILEDVGEDPHKFCSSSVAKVKKLVSELYKNLPKN